MATAASVAGAIRASPSRISPNPRGAGWFVLTVRCQNPSAHSARERIGLSRRPDRHPEFYIQTLHTASMPDLMNCSGPGINRDFL